MMRYLSIVILVIIFFSACDADRCTQSFSRGINISVLPPWERKTQIDIGNQKYNKLLSLLKSEKEDKISIFDRKAFISDLSKTKQLIDYKFNSLIIVEVNSSGERYRRIKYLVALCGFETTIAKYQLNQGKWELIKVNKIKTKEVDDAIRVLTDRNDNTIYWGDNMNDLVAVSKFRGHNEISVEVFGTLSEKQYKALGILER